MADQTSSKNTATGKLYRRILKMPQLRDQDIDEMRRCIAALARTICEHVWKRKFY